MRTTKIATAACAILLGLTTAPAIAQGSPGDDKDLKFLQTVLLEGIPFRDGVEIIHEGYKVCKTLNRPDNGINDPAQIISNYVASGRLDEYDATTFVNLAVETYCPEWTFAL